MDNGEWHAEVALDAPTGNDMEQTSLKQSLAVAQDGIEDAESARADEGGVSRTVDTVALQQLHTALEQTARDAEPPVIERKPEAQSAQSRADARKARRLRRETAGTYKSEATAKRRQAEDDKRVSTVLEKIEGLEGRDPRQERREALEKFKRQQAAKQGGKEAVAKQTQAKSTSKPKRETWQVEKEALKEKFGEQGWQPRKRLSPDTMEGIRALHASDPAAYTTATLSDHFKISPEAIRRILKSKWRPNDREAEDRRARWERRGAKKWQEMAELGVRPPAKWRALGAGGEEGLKDERLPKRRRKSDAHLSWDEVVGDGMEEGEEESLAGRIL